jgi:Transposase
VSWPLTSVRDLIAKIRFWVVHTLLIRGLHYGLFSSHPSRILIRVIFQKGPSMLKNYLSEFKSTAVRELENGKDINQLARELGVTKNTLYRWQQEAQRPKPLAPN